ncbi:hypothetical protein RYZ26_01815 [Terasakiella sp. A23]|uniref:hypothetical protein n=1 Tax=Terasakiella sp. FCG-A23 TaxID=3080561 RepID=UPI0029536AB9|nr:hypothetical protein [Terasakiella sp. A23]MDV7338314.1 hypothetical protein [Terasakiella sp. A23]
MPQDFLFDLNAFGERGVELAQLAGSEEAAGRIETLSGSVTVRRLNGETASLAEGDEIFMGDTLDVAGNGSVGVIFADDTTLALGSGAQMIIDEMVYDPANESGSLALTVADGVFSFVSGQIAKTQDEAMVINTPVATIGIRGTKGAGIAAQEGSENRITLMPEDDGQTGEIIVRNDAGVQVLNQPGQSLAFNSRFAPPPPPSLMSESEMQAAYGSALNVMPPPPRRRGGNEGQAAQNGEDAASAEGEAPPEDGEQVAQEGDPTQDGEAVPADEVIAEEIPVEDAPPEEGLAAEQDSMFADVGGPLGEAPVGEPIEGGEGDGDLIGGAGGDVFGSGQIGGDVGGEGLGFGDIGLTDPNDLLGDPTGEEVPFQEAPPKEEASTDNNQTETQTTQTTTSINTVVGTSAGEQVLGSTGNDSISGLAGHDWILGDGGNDIIDGGDGDDVIYGDEPVIGRATTDTFGLEVTTGSTMDTHSYNLTATNSDRVAFSTSGALDALDTNATNDAYIKTLSDGSITWISHKADGGVSNGASTSVQLSGDGKYAFFLSTATDLAVTSSDTDAQLYRLDIANETLELVSADSGATEGTSAVLNYSVSDDGNLIAFESTSTYGDTQDINAVSDVFIKNMTTGALTLVSIETDNDTDGVYGSFAPVISGDGTKVVYYSEADGLSASDGDFSKDVYIYDVASQTNTLISVSTASVKGDADSKDVDVSSDGQWVVFASTATNLIDGSTDAQAYADIFLRDTVNNTTVKVTDNYLSAESDGDSFMPSVSDDGRYVVFYSAATDMVQTDPNGASHDVFIKDMVTNEVRALNTPLAGTANGYGNFEGHISNDGSVVMFYSTSALVPGETDGAGDIFLASNPFIAETGGGNDTINGGAGNDTLAGGSGDDTYQFDTGFGLDTIVDSSGTDTINFSDVVIETGNETLSDISAADITKMDDVDVSRSGDNLTIKVDASNQVVIVDQFAGNEVETVHTDGQTFNFAITSAGGSTNDILVAVSSGSGNLQGFAGEDGIFGNVGADLIDGGADRDLLKGNDGNDTILGGDGGDALLGGNGDDTLIGGTGNDFVYGGAGADNFRFDASSGLDRVYDFTTGTDKIQIDFASFSISITTANPITFEQIGGTYDGTNAASGAHVVLDGNGDLYVDNNGTASDGYSVIATLDTPTVAVSDIEDV